jgi:hypothetical protein
LEPPSSALTRGRSTSHYDRDTLAGVHDASFDGAGGTDVADIFAFLAAWFAGCG